MESELVSVSQRLASLMLKLNDSDTASQMEFLPEEECAALFGDNYTEAIEENKYNLACLPHAPVLDNYKIGKSLILFVMAVFSLVGNLATMYSIHKSKRRRHGHIYSLLYHLSIADLCVTFWCIVGEAIWHLTVEWKLGVIECKFFKFAQMFSLYLSAYIMVLIGVDRFVAVKYPLRSMQHGYCFRFISICWILSGILSFPQIIVFDVRRGPFQEPFYQCVTHGVYTAEWQEHVYTLFTLLFTFIVPLIILASTYILTVCTLHKLQDQQPCWKKPKFLKGNEEFLDYCSNSSQALVDPNRRKLIRGAKMKSLRISVAIVCVFLVCWTPYYVAMIIYLFSEDKNLILDSSDLISTIIFFFGMANSFCNPVIYGIFHLWRPRRKELQRGQSSTRKTLLTNVSFQRRRSGTSMIGTLINDPIGIPDSRPLTPNRKSPIIKNCFQQWINGGAPNINEVANTVL